MRKVLVKGDCAPALLCMVRQPAAASTLIKALRAKIGRFASATGWSADLLARVGTLKQPHQVHLLQEHAYAFEPHCANDGAAALGTARCAPTMK